MFINSCFVIRQIRLFVHNGESYDFLFFRSYSYSEVFSISKDFYFFFYKLFFLPIFLYSYSYIMIKMNIFFFITIKTSLKCKILLLISRCSKAKASIANQRTPISEGWGSLLSTGSFDISDFSAVQKSNIESPPIHFCCVCVLLFRNKICQNRNAKKKT